MDRKQFIGVCGGSLASFAVLSSLGSCKGTYYAMSTTSGKKIFVQLSEFSYEDKKGNKVEREFVLLRHDQLNFPIAVYKHPNGKYAALYLECTHRGCEVKAEPGGLQCPCHGSEFSIAGKVTQPPAEEDLKQFPVTVDNNQIIIEIPAS